MSTLCNLLWMRLWWRASRTGLSCWCEACFYIRVVKGLWLAECETKFTNDSFNRHCCNKFHLCFCRTWYYSTEVFFFFFFSTVSANVYEVLFWRFEASKRPQKGTNWTTAVSSVRRKFMIKTLKWRPTYALPHCEATYAMGFLLLSINSTPKEFSACCICHIYFLPPFI